MTVLYFKKWFQYDHQVNIKILDILKNNHNFEAIQAMAHIIVAQKLWMCRIQETSFDFSLFDKKFDFKEIESLFLDQHQKIKEYLDSIQDQDLSFKINFKNKNGDLCHFEIQDIITHIFNHGTHHRAQILWLLKPHVSSLPILDYIHNLN
jgi:uncharacterized damage-inducible protein DinB